MDKIKKEKEDKLKVLQALKDVALKLVDTCSLLNFRGSTTIC